MKPARNATGAQLVTRLYDRLVDAGQDVYALTAEAVPSWLGVDETDRMLLALPLFHINAQAYSVMGALGAGAGLAIAPRFSASRFWDDARALGATQFNAVGAMIHILLKSEPRASDRGHLVRRCYTALALAEPLHRGFEERFGLSMSVGFGMSETTFGTVWPRELPPRYGTMGRLRQHPRLGEINRARVVRNDGTEASDGETGELWLQNPATMLGYWNDPTQTAVVLEGGWLHTGDLVKRDADSFFTFLSRKKDVIRRRGENVAASEIEGVLLGHPTVREAAAVGVGYGAAARRDVDAPAHPGRRARVRHRRDLGLCPDQRAGSTLARAPAVDHQRRSLERGVPVPSRARDRHRIRAGAVRSNHVPRRAGLRALHPHGASRARSPCAGWRAPSVPRGATPVRCVCITALGAPVVPDVASRTHTSSG